MVQVLLIFKAWPRNSKGLSKPQISNNKFRNDTKIIDKGDRQRVKVIKEMMIKHMNSIEDAFLLVKSIMLINLIVRFLKQGEVDFLRF